MVDELKRHSERTQQDAPGRVLVFPDAEGMGRFVARTFGEISAAAIGERGCFLVALSGGKTPIESYREIARDRDAIDWKRVHVFLVDERFVPYHDEQSNYGMIKRSLLHDVGIPQANVHPVPIEGDPATSAERYESELRAFMSSDRDSPTFDMILLGMGEDGHTASLFPGTQILGDDEHLVRAAGPDGARIARVTLTLPVINRGRNVVFLVSGTAKAGTVRRVIEEKDPGLPASLVRPARGELFFLLDEEAASTLALRGGE